MNIIIIGNNSTFGKELYKLLYKEHNVYTTGRRGKYDIYLDLSKKNNINVNIFADIVIHCAAAFDDDSYDGYRNNINVNTLGVIEAVELAKLVRCKKFIYISSISVYDNEKNEYLNTAYSISKKMGEELCGNLCSNNNIQFLSLRFGQLYDLYGGELKNQPFLYNLIEKIYYGKNIEIWGRVDADRNYLCICDAANILKGAIENDLVGCYPVMSAYSYKISELIELIMKSLNNEILYAFIKDKPNIKNIFIPENINEIYEVTSYKEQFLLERAVSIIVKEVIEKNEKN